MSTRNIEVEKFVLLPVSKALFVLQKAGAPPSKCGANNGLIKLILILHESKKRKIQDAVTALYFKMVS